MTTKPKAPRKSKAAPYWWFGSETIDALKERLGAAGPGTRLEVRLDGKKMTLRVVPAGVTTADAAGDDLNKSNICPPICP